MAFWTKSQPIPCRRCLASTARLRISASSAMLRKTIRPDISPSRSATRQRIPSPDAHPSPTLHRAASGMSDNSSRIHSVSSGSRSRIVTGIVASKDFARFSRFSNSFPHPIAGCNLHPGATRLQLHLAAPSRIQASRLPAPMHSRPPQRHSRQGRAVPLLARLPARSALARRRQ